MSVNGKSYLIQIRVEIPYPKEFSFTEQASGVGTAISRAIRKLRKQLPRRKLTRYGITATQL